MNQEATGLLLAKAVEEQDHAQGPATALVTLVAYGDYQCKHTRAAHPVVKELQQKLGDKLRFVFRHFPRSAKHEFAQSAAEAAEAAGAQGMFWEMHSCLLEHQDDLSDHALTECAEEVGLDIDLFERHMGEHECAGHVSSDIRSAIRSGVQETPTFFINDVRYDGPHDVDAMAQAIMKAISRKQQ